MSYMDNGPLPRHHTRLTRSPLPADRPPVDDILRGHILEASGRLPNFTAAEIVAELASLGVRVHRDDVRAVWES